MNKLYITLIVCLVVATQSISALDIPEKENGKEAVFPVSYDKPAEQSSTKGFGYASKAVDGQYDPFSKAKYCSLTTNERNPWWSVDLLKEYEIKSINVWTDSDFDNEKIDSLEVLCSDDGVDFKVCHTHNQEILKGRQSTFLHVDLKTRHIKIRIPGNEKRVLKLCEVDIRGLRPRGVNPIVLSRAEKARQSSTERDRKANRAVDDNVDPNVNAGHCSQTKDTRMPWWEIDLGEQFIVTDTVIYTHSKNEQGAPLQDLDIMVRNSTTDTWHYCLQKSWKGPAKPQERITLPCHMQGRYVRIQSSNKQALTLCEVRVYGWDHKTQPQEKVCDKFFKMYENHQLKKGENILTE